MNWKITFVVLMILAAINVGAKRIKRYTLDQCGEPLKPGGLINHGTISKKDQWPYLVALFDIAKAKFFCGGTLISLNHILTAAHCLQEKGKTASKKASSVIAYLGKYDLNITHERGAVPVYPTEIVIHEDWNPLEAKYDADIAIIKLDEEVPIRSNIYPICLWTADMRPLRNDDGYVVGWGTSENQAIGQHENVPREVKLRIVTNEVCFAVEQLSRIISYRTFCAGGQNAGPCRGDSGGGMYASRGLKWFIRGIVSSSLFKSDNSCDVDKYAVFTSVEKYTNWINSILGVKIEVHCDYSVGGDRYYCKPTNLKIDHSNIHIAETSGTHVGRRLNSDVNEIVIHNQQTPYLPAMISEIFPNLLKYFAGASRLQYIDRNNFDGLSRLTQIEFGVNNIEKIPKDTFYGLPYLESLLLHKNRIDSLDRDLFIKNVNLKEIYIYGNRIAFLDDGLFRNNMKLEGFHIDDNLLQFIEPELLTPLVSLKVANFNSNSCLSESFPGKNLAELKEIFKAKCKV